MNWLVRRRVAFAFAAAFALASPSFGQSAAPRIQLLRELVLDAEREDFPVVNGGRVNTRLDIALTIRQDYQVRVYDGNGKRLATIGRKGQAPGEFLSPQAQGWLADTIWIYDATLKRHAFYTRDGRLLRTAPLETLARSVRVVGDSARAQLTDFLPWVRRSDGALVGTAAIARDERTGSTRERVLAALRRDGTAIKLTNTDQDSRWEIDVAFTPFPAASPSGREIVVASVSDLAVSGAYVLLSRFDERGTARGVTRVPYTGVPYPAELRDRLLKRGNGPDQNQTVTASRVPKVQPPVYNLLVRDDGIVLLMLRGTADSQSATLIDARGVVRGVFELPTKADVIATLGDHVWLRERDRDDLVSIVRYRMLCGRRACALE
ncbi:MAG: hypothetical protein IT354_00605 [Gemmatimonadaceae bacterium]|nr:hypothetical protein [Gemmatimonadaceae bacterium]